MAGWLAHCRPTDWPSEQPNYGPATQPAAKTESMTSSTLASAGTAGPSVGPRLFFGLSARAPRFSNVGTLAAVPKPRTRSSQVPACVGTRTRSLTDAHLEPKSELPSKRASPRCSKISDSIGTNMSRILRLEPNSRLRSDYTLLNTSTLIPDIAFES